MNVHFPAPRRKWPARLVNLAVVIVVIALAAATFVLSYSGVHAIVLQEGVSARLARIYPGLFDAVFVIACVAAVMPREARWWARAYAWLVIILMVAVVGAADAVHAMSVALRHRPMEGVVAAAPWVLVLLGFSLLLTMLRQSRARHAAEKAPAEPAYAAPVPETRALPAAPVDAPEADTTDLSAVRDADAWPVPDVAASGDTGPVGEEPVPVAVPDEAPAAEHEAAAAEEHKAAAEPAVEPAVEPTAAADGESEEAVTASYDYWDSGADAGFAGRGNPPTVPGQVIDEDAPPFATAPFASVPRLNRVRSTPTPPEDGDEEE